MERMATDLASTEEYSNNNHPFGGNESREMKKENVLIILCGLSVSSGLAAWALDAGFGFAYACIGALVFYVISLCGRADQITLATQSLDEAKLMMEDKPGTWHLVAVSGRCVVAYRSERQALDSMGRDGIGYAVVGA